MWDWSVLDILGFWTCPCSSSVLYTQNVFWAWTIYIPFPIRFFISFLLLQSSFPHMPFICTQWHLSLLVSFCKPASFLEILVHGLILWQFLEDIHDAFRSCFVAYKIGEEMTVCHGLLLQHVNCGLEILPLRFLSQIQSISV